MPLVTTNEMLKKAQAGHYAVGAFNVENMEMVMAVIKAAEEMNSPVIMQTTPSTVKYAGLDYYLAMVRTAAERASVPVAIHLDHGSSFELAMQALRGLPQGVQNQVLVCPDTDRVLFRLQLQVKLRLYVLQTLLPAEDLYTENHSLLQGHLLYRRLYRVQLLR